MMENQASELQIRMPEKQYRIKKLRKRFKTKSQATVNGLFNSPEADPKQKHEKLLEELQNNRRMIMQTKIKFFEVKDQIAHFYNTVLKE